jgi:hypothetical protein
MPGHNNWFDINLKKGLNNNEIPFEAKLSIPIKSIVTDFTIASDQTAKLIANTYQNLYICLSGGLDSEYVANVFLRNKIPFTAIIICTIENIGEVWFAKHFCNQNNISPIILDYTTCENLYVSKLLQFGKKLKLQSGIAFMVHLAAEFAEENNGSLVTGYGEPFSNSNDYDYPMGLILEIEEHDYYLDVSFDKKHPGAFFSYTPDMLFSMVNSIQYDKNTQLAKTNLYKIPGRSKIMSTIQSEKFNILNTILPKDPNLKCIKVRREKFLHDMLNCSTIVLSSKDNNVN